MAYHNIGEAEKAAQHNANRDDCRWYIRHAAPSSPYYEISDEFTDSPFPSSCPPVRWIGPQKQRQVEDDNVVHLTKEQKELVLAVIDPNEPGRDYFPGDEQVKRSLMDKLLGRKK